MKKTIIPLVDYLLSLTNINGTLICDTPRRTFIIGKLQQTIISLVFTYPYLIVQKYFRFCCSYKISFFYC